MKTLNWILLATAGSMLLSGCNKDNTYDFAASQASAQTEFAAAQAAAPATTPVAAALFNPSTSTVPSATNLLMLGSADGTLNIPIATTDSAGVQALKSTLNALDGFSTTAPIVTEFSTTLAQNSIVPRFSVRIFEVTINSASAVTGVVGELTAGDFTAVATGSTLSTLTIVPLKPLKPKSSYMVVLTNGLKASDGTPMQADVAYALTKSTTALTGSYAALEPLRQLTGTFEAAAQSAGVAPASIILSWVFSTQSTTDVLQSLAASSVAGAITAAPTGATTAMLNPALAGKADVSTGTLDVPYYLTAASPANPTAPLTQRWLNGAGGELTRYAPAPAATSTETIPLLLTTPNATAAGGGCVAPAAGWPVVIFQHGITQQKDNLLAIADALADACMAGIAIDMPLHGDRTFGIDFVNNTTGAPGPDGIADPSGQHFINLNSLLTSRDNVRQAVSDLLVLHKSLAGIAGLDANNVSFIGHSLGAIVGTLFVAVDPNLVSASLAMPGSGIARLLDGSVEFGPEIQAGLAAAGITAGSADYNSFMVVAQSALDSADPINFAADVTLPIHLIEVVGGAGSPSDTVIPNRVAGSPLSGTEPLVTALNLMRVTGSHRYPGLRGAVRFTRGDHGSLLTPDSRFIAGVDTLHLPTMVEMQTQAVTFVASGGSNITITDPTFIVP